jgi:hypothetical protein
MVLVSAVVVLGYVFWPAGTPDESQNPARLTTPVTTTRPQAP